METYPTHLQLMSDWVTVSIQVEDQGLLLCDGAGVWGRATYTKTILHLHTFPFTEDWCEALNQHLKHIHSYSCHVLHASGWKGISAWGRRQHLHNVVYLAGEHRLDHLCVLTGEHRACQTKDHTHCRQQHEQWHLWRNTEPCFDIGPRVFRVLFF